MGSDPQNLKGVAHSPRPSPWPRNSVGPYPNTALFNPPKKNSGAGEWPKLFRENNLKKQGLCRRRGGVPLFLPKSAKFSRGAAPPDAPSPAHGARSDGARRCDGVAAVTEQRRPAPSRSFCASRRADAAATELMLRAALLRRSCDGVAAATESLL